MRKLSIWHLAILGSVAFLAAGLIAAINEKGMGSSDTAGWVQAIGAILAIVGAFLVVNHQHRKERARDAEIEVEEVRAMLLSLRDDHVDDKPLRFWLWPTFKRR